MQILSKSLKAEIEWWAKRISSPDGDKDLRDRANPTLPVQDYIARYLVDGTESILDVGSGPVTLVGYIFNNRRVNIVAVDPLADQYNALSLPQKLPVKTQSGFGEN